MSAFMNAMRRALPTLLGGLMLLVGLVHAGTVTYVYTDPQGTPLAEADASGNITATFDYAPYGTQALGAPPSGPGYTGHVNDPESGLVYMQARYYDPAVGRFLSVDPVGPSAGNTFNFNRYDYTSNNPINHTDPDGRCPDFMCGQMLGAHVQWRMSHPGAPADGMEKAAMVGTGVMTVGSVGVAVGPEVGVAVLRRLGYALLSGALSTNPQVENNAVSLEPEAAWAEAVIQIAEARSEIEVAAESLMKRLIVRTAVVPASTTNQSESKGNATNSPVARDRGKSGPPKSGVSPKIRDVPKPIEKIKSV